MDLFGTQRKELKQQIHQLEDQIEELEQKNQYLQEAKEQAEDNRKKAITERQNAEKKVNKLQDTIEGLKGKITNSNSQTHQAYSQTVDAPTMDNIARTINSLTIPRNQAFTKYESSNEKGLITLADPYLIGIQIITPFPFSPSTYQDNCYTTAPLQDQLNDRYLYIHLTDGGSGIAIITDISVEKCELIDADIKSGHKKGGYSQKRFERLRQQQMDEHIKRVADALDNFGEHGYTKCILTGSEKLIDKFNDKTSTEYATRTTKQGAVASTADLLRGFKSAMSCTIQQLSTNQRKNLIHD